MLFFYTAITLGFLGSFHCIGMCGPIALALPVHHFGILKKHTGILLYQLGRLFTYSTLGLLFGLMGQAFFPAGFQQGLSVGMGVLILLAMLAGRLNRLPVPHLAALHRLIARLKAGLLHLFRKKGLGFLFLTGLLNGLLPCGLVYIGIAGAAATGNYVRGTLFMLGFGLGTLPAMYAVAILGQFVNSHARSQVRKALPVIITSMALLLILRGLNLGIPYLSPAMEVQDKTTHCNGGEHHRPSKTLICCPKKH